jgi:hypothetical protein
MAVVPGDIGGFFDGHQVLYNIIVLYIDYYFIIIVVLI